MPEQDNKKLRTILNKLDVKDYGKIITDKNRDHIRIRTINEERVSTFISFVNKD